jgi:hypothetical protein
MALPEERQNEVSRRQMCLCRDCRLRSTVSPSTKSVSNLHTPIFNAIDVDVLLDIVRSKTNVS